MVYTQGTFASVLRHCLSYMAFSEAFLGLGNFPDCQLESLVFQRQALHGMNLSGLEFGLASGSAVILWMTVYCL